MNSLWLLYPAPRQNVYDHGVFIQALILVNTPFDVDGTTLLAT